MSTIKSAGNVFSIVILSVLIGSVAGCVKTGSSSTSTGTNISFISLMNMAPYSPSTEVYFNNTKQTSAVAAGSYSGNYGQIAGGAYGITFKVSGKDSILSELPSSNYDSLGFYTLILYNTAGGASAKSVKISDNFSNLSVSGANYRFFQLSPDAPLIDLYLNSTAVQNGRSLADNVASPTYNLFQTLTPGVYDIVAKKAGSDSVVASATGISMSAANAYTIFLQGSTSNTSDPISLKVLLATY